MSNLDGKHVLRESNLVSTFGRFILCTFSKQTLRMRPFFFPYCTMLTTLFPDSSKSISHPRVKTTVRSIFTMKTPQLRLRLYFVQSCCSRAVTTDIQGVWSNEQQARAGSGNSNHRWCYLVTLSPPPPHTHYQYTNTKMTNIFFNECIVSVCGGGEGMMIDTK